jgi:hypothetical protein
MTADEIGGREAAAEVSESARVTGLASSATDNVRGPLSYFEDRFPSESSPLWVVR